MTAPAPAIRRVPPRFTASEPWYWPTGATLVIDPVAGRIVLRRHILHLFRSHADRPVTEVTTVRAARYGAGPWGIEAVFTSGETWVVRMLHPFASEAEAYVQADRARDAAGLS